MSQTKATALVSSVEDDNYFKQVESLVSAIGARLAATSDADFPYRMTFRGCAAKFETLADIIDWFQSFGQHERLLGNQEWTIQSYDSAACSACYPCVNADELEAGQTVRLPFSKGHPWRILSLGKETSVNVMFRYVPTVGNGIEPITVCFNKLWRFQLLAHANGSSAYSDKLPF